MDERKAVLEKVVSVNELAILFPQWSQRSIYRKLDGKGVRRGYGKGIMLYHIDDATEILGVDNDRRKQGNS
jgi:hypothetical protein